MKIQELSFPFQFPSSQLYLTDLRALLNKSFGEHNWNLDLSSLSEVPQGIQADLSFPCFPLAATLKKSPIQIAQILVANFPNIDTQILNRVEAVGPYLNLFFYRAKFSEIVLKNIFIQKEEFGHFLGGRKQKVMIEYSSPNTNKPQHLGHLRNNLLGWTSAELLKAIDFQVIKSSIINDRGIHICKSMLAYQKWGAGETPKSTGLKPDHFVGKYYVKFSQELKKEKDAYWHKKGLNNLKLNDQEEKLWEEKFLQESELQKEAQEMLQKWEQEDPQIIALWKTMNNWVYEGFDQTYRNLGVDFDKVYYESQIYKDGKEIISQALKKAYLKRRADGAIVADLNKYGLGKKVVLRSDSTSIYITQDINLAFLKFMDFDLNYSVYVVGSEQEYYLQQLFAVLDLIHFPYASRMHHLSYGMVNLPNGKMKSREGTVVDADDLISQMTDLAKEVLRKRYPNLEQLELNKRSRAIALAAIKVYMLNTRRLSETIFNPQKSISFEGQTGPYLQYTYARAASILRKADKKYSFRNLVLDKINDSEWKLIQSLEKFPSQIYRAAINYEPLFLLDSLFTIAHQFNHFYRSCPILTVSENKIQEFRLNLVGATKQVLANGFKILGIEVLEKM